MKISFRKGIFLYLFALSLFDILIIISCLLIAALYPTLSVLFVSVFIIAGRLNGLGVILHDLCHMDSTQENYFFKMIELLCGIPLASNAKSMAYHHLLHHQETLTKNDPYFRISQKKNPILYILGLVFNGGLFIPFWSARLLFSPFALLFKSQRNIYGHFFLQNQIKQDLRNDPKTKECIWADVKILIPHLGYLTLLFYFQQWLAPLFWAIPVAGIFCILRLSFEHNYGEGAYDQTPDPIFTSNNHHLSFLSNVFITPHNVGYHQLHHLYPQVSLRDLPKLAKD